MVLNKDRKTKLTDLMQDQFQDLSIVRDKPLIFNNERGLLLIIQPVMYVEHDLFLKDMAKIIVKYYEIFESLNFLNTLNYQDKEEVNKLVSNVSIFTANKKYSKFKKDTLKFVSKWAFVSKVKTSIGLKHKPRLCKKYLKTITPSEFIHILFLIFVMNFDIVKKNLIELMRTIHIKVTTDSNTQMDMSSPGILKEVSIQENILPLMYVPMEEIVGLKRHI